MTTVGELLQPDAKLSAAAQAAWQKARGALAVDVRDLLMDAWRTRSKLREAARETLATPGLVRKVTLKTFALPWEHSMELDVRLNGQHVASVSVGVRVELEVSALEAVVQGGRLTAIEGGTYTATASGTVADHPLIGKSKTFDLRYELPLGEGIALVS